MNNEKMPIEVRSIIDLWKSKKESFREEWNKGGWPAKTVSIEFTYQGKDYAIKPEMIGEEGPWGHGFMEFINTEIGKDLIEIGATDLAYFGFLD